MDIYTGAMGMISFQGKLDVIGNNIANAKTNGFKADKESFKVFEESFIRIKENGTSKRIGSIKDQVYIDQITTNFDTGLVRMTDRKLDFNLEDQKNNDGTKNVSFFVLEQNGQEYLTRNGHYMLDSEGYLSTANGAFLMDAEGNRIQIPEGRDYYIQPNGEIRFSDNNELLAAIQIQQVDEKHLGYLEKSHSAFFKVMTVEDIERNFGPIQELIDNFDQHPTLQKIFKDKEKLEEIAQDRQVDVFEDFEGTLKGSMLEDSNVDLSYEMTEMMVAQKGFSASQKVTSTFDRINEKASNEVGR